MGKITGKDLENLKKGQMYRVTWNARPRTSFELQFLDYKTHCKSILLFGIDHPGYWDQTKIVDLQYIDFVEEI